VLVGALSMTKGVQWTDEEHTAANNVELFTRMACRGETRDSLSKGMDINSIILGVQDVVHDRR
jgi:hypothetical protein